MSTSVDKHISRISRIINGRNRAIVYGNDSIELVPTLKRRKEKVKKELKIHQQENRVAKVATDTNPKVKTKGIKPDRQNKKSQIQQVNRPLPPWIPTIVLLFFIVCFSSLGVQYNSVVDNGSTKTWYSFAWLNIGKWLTSNSDY